MKALLREGLAWYLRFWARPVLRRHKPRIIGVTGSVGKTTTKETIAAVLMHAGALPIVGPVRKSAGNMNDNKGLPLIVLGYSRWPKSRLHWIGALCAMPFRALALTTARSYPGVMVLEYGAGWGGDVGRLAELAPPEVAVITLIGPAHLERFGTVERVVQEKSALVRGVPPSGLVVLSGDNRYASDMDRQARARVVKVPGKGSVFSENAARAVGRYFGLPEEVVDRALSERGVVKGRLEIRELEYVTVINDSFNANPMSMQYGLDTLAERARPDQRKVAILGDMGELGAEGPRYHREIAAYARERADVVIGVGDLARHYQPDHWFATSDDCADNLQDLVRRGDLLFVKGSQSARLRRVVGRLERIARESLANDHPTSERPAS